MIESKNVPVKRKASSGHYKWLELATCSIISLFELSISIWDYLPLARFGFLIRKNGNLRFKKRTKVPLGILKQGPVLISIWNVLSVFTTYYRFIYKYNRVMKDIY